MRYLVILLLLVVWSCAQMPRVCPDYTKENMNFACPRQWNEKDAEYHLRQAGTISFADKEIPVEGFMILEPEKFKARLTVWSIFGMKMFSMTVLKEQIKCDHIQPGLERIPDFISLAGNSVRRSFMQTLTRKRACIQEGGKIRACQQTEQGPLSLIYNEKGLLKKKELKSVRSNWSVTYADYFSQDKEKIPGSIVYVQKEFKVNLKIKEVDKLCPVK